MVNINLSNVSKILRELTEGDENEHYYHIELESVNAKDTQKFTLHVGDTFEITNDDDPTHPPIDIHFCSVEEKKGKFHHSVKIFLNPWKRDALLEMMEGKEE